MKSRRRPWGWKVWRQIRAIPNRSSEAGLGVLWLPKYMSRPHEAQGELVPLFEDWHLEPMPLYLAYPPNRHISAKLRVFIDWVVELMAQHAPVDAKGSAQ